MQYSFKTSMEEEKFNKLLERTKLLFDLSGIPTLPVKTFI